ncbi:GNAT family N-acetyltransferase [Candidatus Poribacteria bacterium]
MIKEILSDSELQESAKVIRDSFITVATDLNLNAENCPTHPTFISFTELKRLREKGAETFALFHRNRQVEFVAVEKASDALYYMEKLAVLPEYRHRGFGKKLMDFVFDYVKQRNGDTVSIGIINEHSVLKNWYSDYGFVETGIRRFEHLPFQVCFMEKKVG